MIKRKKFMVERRENQESDPGSEMVEAFKSSKTTVKIKKKFCLCLELNM